MHNPGPPALAVHRAELGRLRTFSLAPALLVGSTWLHPALAPWRPRFPGEPLPLHRLLPGRAKVRELHGGERASQAPAPPAEPAPETLPSPSAASVLPARPPALPTPIEQPEALASCFHALQRLEAGEPGLIVRALHWGDSTIAGDGITSTVRDRPPASAAGSSASPRSTSSSWCSARRRARRDAPSGTHARPWAARFLRALAPARAAAGLDGSDPPL